MTVAKYRNHRHYKDLPLGICSVCGLQAPVRKEASAGGGTIVDHRSDNPANHFYEDPRMNCTGSNKPPKEEM